MEMSKSLPEIADIRQAATRLAGIAVRTPLLTNQQLDAETGAKVYLKPECLQRTGSFKIRGAYNAIFSQLSEARARGVVASSSGNHAQGVAQAARLTKVAATIVMPHDAPAIKIARTRRSGAEIVFYQRGPQNRDQVLKELQTSTGALMVHPYDDRLVIAGQGTAGLEAADDLDQLGVEPDRVLVCAGGGGLSAGVALAIHDRFPTAKIHPVEPAEFDDHARSLKSGKRERNQRAAGSISDALLVESPGVLTFAINRDHLSRGLVVSDDEARAAIRFAANELKLVLEPGGACALAALRQADGGFAGETVLVYLTGGNIDPALLAEILTAQT